ncbi:hypothetical protein F7725_006245 [Dissostichus mawsoni]|uniref:Uncharacterized protein n=1 Tax=Dissostichus mawsoni TaxID=36200 RepID=A0A7J5YTW2_DISMA|nr:hypothetical protein F7725_006245 [Dissostichus mawsoni]
MKGVREEEGEGVTPRPPLTPSPSRTPLRYPSLPPERSLYSGLGCSIRPGLTSGAELKERTQSGVESSGYSSSEGPLLWKTPSNTRNTSKGPNAGYWGRIRGAFYSLMAASVSGRMKKAFALLLLFLIALLCKCLAPPPSVDPLVSRMASLSLKLNQRVSLCSSPPLLLFINPTPYSLLMWWIQPVCLRLWTRGYSISGSSCSVGGCRGEDATSPGNHRPSGND